MFTKEVITCLERSVLGWLATVDEQGHPNVSPKEIFAAWDDRTILIAHIASPVSVKNIRSNPLVCFSFVDVLIQKGFKLKGSARILETGADFYVKQERLQQLFTDRFPIAALIEMNVQSISPILAPSYQFFPETTEASQIAAAMQAYGLRPGSGINENEAPMQVNDV